MLDNLRDLTRLVDVLRAGGPVRDDHGVSRATVGGVRPDDPEGSRAFLDMLYRGSERMALETFQWTRHLLPDGAAHVLDLGGGHGRYARTFADAGHRATLADLPMVVEIARDRHGEHLEYIEGNFLQKLDLGGPYDLVLLSNIVHGQSAQENAALVARLAEILRPGGVLVLKDMFLDDRERYPARAVFFGLTMLFYTEQGRSYSLSEAAGWFRAAGLEAVAVTSLDTHDLHIARRPR